MHHFGEQSGGGGSFLGGFDDDAVAAGQRGSDLPGEQQERQIPRRDDSDDAKRFADRVIESYDAAGSFRAKGFESSRLDHIGEGAEIGGAAGDINARSERDGFPGVRDFGVHQHDLIWAIKVSCLPLIFTLDKRPKECEYEEQC